MRTQLVAWLAALLLARGGLAAPAPAWAFHPTGIKAKSAVLMDARTGRVLWSRKPTQVRAIASTTKILTALVVSQADQLDKKVSIVTTPPVSNGSMSLRPGDALTRRQLLYALLLKSANDAAWVLAVDVAGSQEAFASRMNHLARQIGNAEGVLMSNPHGLPDRDHHATALAVASWSRRLLEDEQLAPIVQSKRFRLGGRFGTIVSTNWLLFKDPRILGIKTGYTDAAGYCLAAAGRRPQATLIAVVLGSPTEQSRFTDAARMLRWGYSRFQTRTVVVADQAYATPLVPDWGDRRVRLVASSQAKATVLIGGPKLERQVVAPKAMGTPIIRGQEAGFVRVTQEGRLLATVPLVAAEPIPAPSFWDRLRLLLYSLFRRRVAVGSARPLCYNPSQLDKGAISDGAPQRRGRPGEPHGAIR